MDQNPQLTTLRRQLAAICERRVAPSTARVVEELARPAIRLRHTDRPTGSHLGGAALLDDPEHWPDGDGRPLSLVAVLDLSELAGFDSDPPLAEDGVLNFFYDSEQQPWGFDPRDRHGWQVVAADPASARPVSAPQGAESFVSIGLQPQQTLSIPGWEEPAVGSVVPPHEDRGVAAETARREYFSMEDDWSGIVDGDSTPNHQVGGWPRLQQGPIWRECQVVSGGLALGTSDEWSRAEPTFDPGREAEWRLLLQLDTDDDAGWMWGDVGTLYFAVRQSSPVPAASGDGWLVLQCG